MVKPNKLISILKKKRKAISLKSTITTTACFPLQRQLPDAEQPQHVAPQQVRQQVVTRQVEPHHQVEEEELEELSRLLPLLLLPKIQSPV